MKPKAHLPRSLTAFGCSVVFATTLASCSLYRSSDRDDFDGNALAGAPTNNGQDAKPTGCGDWLSEPEAAKAFFLPNVELSLSNDTPSSVACRISAPRGSEAALATRGADSAICSRVSDFASLMSEGLNLIADGEASRIDVNKYHSLVEFTFARKSPHSATAAICKFAFKTQRELDDNFDLARMRAERLTRALLDSTSTP